MSSPGPDHVLHLNLDLDPDPTLIHIHAPVPSLMDMMIIQDQGPHEVEVMVGAIEKITMLIIDMIEVKSEETVKRRGVIIIQWYVSNGVCFQCSLSCMYF